MPSENVSSTAVFKNAALDNPAPSNPALDRTVTEKIGVVDDFELGAMKMIKAGGRRLLVAKTESGIHAVDNACPHQGYGLTTGQLDDGVVTCQWHNWKFNVDDGVCTRGEEDVASHPITIRGDEVWVSITEPTDEERRADLWPSLRRGIEADYRGQIARDVTRLLDAGATPEDIVWSGVQVGAPKADYGVGHELPAAADCLSMVDMFDGLERALPLTHALAGIAEETRDRPTYVADPAEPGDFQVAVETENRAQAVGALRASLQAGASSDEIASELITAVSRHHLGYGHSLIYTQKACELLDRVGWDRADDLLPHLVTSIVWGTREDTLPYMSKAIRLIDEAPLDKMAEAPDRRDTGWADTDALVATLLDSALAPIEEAVDAVVHGAGVEGLLDAVSLAVSTRMLRYDTSLEAAKERNFAWLDISHGLTYARAARWAWRTDPGSAAARLALFTVFLCFDTGRQERRTGVIDVADRRLSDTTNLATAVINRDPVAAVEIARDGDVDDIGEQLKHLSLTDAAGSFIVAAHLVKMAKASHEEAVEIGSNLPLMATARLAAAPRRERFVSSAVTEAINFIRTGAPPIR